MKMHPIAVSTNSYHGFTVDEALEGIAAAGFHYVELAAVRNWTEHVMPDMPAAEFDRVVKKMRDLDIQCIGVSGHCNLMEEARLNDFRENMKLANKLGAKFIVSSTGEAHFGKDEHFADDVLVNNLKALVPDLEALGLTLVLEVHGEYGTGESLYRIAKKVGSDRVGVNYDTANAVFYGKVLPEEEVKICADGVKYVHLKDKVGLDSVWNFPAIGAGELKLMEFIDILDAHGFDGPLSIEVEYTEAFTMRAKVPGDLAIANAAVKDSYDYLKKMGRI